MLKHKRFVIRTIICALVIAISLSWSWKILQNKSYRGINIHSITSMNFYDLPHRSIDVLFIGSSHSLAGFLPQELYNKFGITSYNISSGLQPVVMSFYWLKEALKSQRPRVVVFETFMLFHGGMESEAAVRQMLDYMHWGLTKVETINAVCNIYRNHSKISYYLPNVRYHDRWKGLNEVDFLFDKMLPEYQIMEYANAYWTNSKDKYQPLEEGSSAEEETMMSYRSEYLKKIILLCKENGIQLILVKTPTIRHDIKRHNTIKRIAYEESIPFYDMNEISLFDKTGIDFNKDIADYGHANFKGALKLTEFIGNLLSMEYGLYPHKSRYWESTKKQGEKFIADYKLKESTDLNEYLSILNKNKNRYTIFIAAKDEASKSLNDQAKAGLKDLGLKPDWTDAYRKSYCAIIENGTVKLDEISKEKLKHKGSYDNGRYVYSIESAGNKVGNNCSVKINNKEQAKRRRGLNFVVFSNERRIVIDSVCFDTFDKNNKCFR